MNIQGSFILSTDFICVHMCVFEVLVSGKKGYASQSNICQVGFKKKTRECTNRPF
jgi:hypothetical protein